MYNNILGEETQRNVFDECAETPIPHEVQMTCLSEVEMKPVNWLWHGRIALGKFTVAAGEPGLGKSQTMAKLAATVSIGGHWPELAPPAPLGDVLFISAEDDPADTIKPRLIAAGADISRCHVLDAVHVFEKKRGFDQEKETIRMLNLKEDAERLETAIRRLNHPQLVIIDPVSAYLGDTDSHNNAAMRTMLTPLAKMAEKLQIGLLLVTHLNKAQHLDMMNRVIGSIGLIAAARAGFAVVKDEQEPDKRYFLPIKNNLGDDRTGFSYTIEGVTLEEGIETSRIVWGDDTVDAHTIFYPEEIPAEKLSKTPAMDFLEALLSEKPLPAKEVYAEADQAGFGKNAIQNAQKRLHIKPQKTGMKGGWVWKLPHQMQITLNGQPINPQREESEESEDAGALMRPASEESSTTPLIEVPDSSDSSDSSNPTHS